MQTWDRWTDKEPTTDELIEHWLTLIRWLANRASRTYGLCFDDRHDLIQSMILKLLALAADKRPSRFPDPRRCIVRTD